MVPMQTACACTLQLFVKYFSYPEYEIIGFDDISKNESVINRNSKRA